ncbi:MAG: DHA2 family efflux MFS transporter permease subunit, partial [Solirubrobacteraceae bacterium]
MRKPPTPTATATAPRADSSDRIPRHVWTLSSVVVLGSIMSILDTTIVNVGLDTMSRDLHSSIAEIQWIVTGYMLSLAAVIPVSGWAARRFGAKQVWILSVALFTTGSVMCGFSDSTTELILFRVVQGVGGGMILPIGQLMMAQAAGPKRMGRVMAIVAVPMMLAPVCGPTIGGLILQNLHWSWIFFVNAPIGVIAVILGIRLLPHTERARTDQLDFVGLALMVTGMPLFVYGLAQVGTTGSFTAASVIWPSAAGLALVVAFVLWALRAKLPLLQLRLYSRATYSTASISMFCLGAGLFGSAILLPLYWQSIRHFSVIDTGLLTGPQGLGMAMVMPIVG